MKNGNINKPRLWAILALAVFLRAFLLLTALHLSGIKAIFAADSHGYIAPIQHLLHGSFATDSGPELQRTPGYPIFLMLTGMVGNHPLLSDGCQILLAGFSVFLVFQIGIFLFHDERVAILCAGLYAIEPLSILYGIELLSECLFTTILLIFLFFFLKHLRASTWSSLLYAALALAATVYVRPASYYLPLCCAIGLAFIPPKVGVAPRLLRALVFLIICSVLIGAWRVRNYVETGYSGFSSIADSNLYFFNAGEVLAQKQHTDFTTELGLLHWQDTPGYLAIHPEQVNWSIAQQLAYQRRMALRTISENKLLYLKDHLRGMAVVLFHPCATDYLWMLGESPLSSVTAFRANADKHGIIFTLWKTFWRFPLVFLGTAMLEVLLMAYYGLAIFGIPSLLQSKSLLITLALIFCYFVVIAGGAAGMARYRYPIMPIVALFAGAGIAKMLRLQLNAMPFPTLPQRCIDRAVDGINC